VELYRRIVGEYKKGETRYWDQANTLLDNITKPSVSVNVSNIFLPESEIQFNLNWRNVKRIDLALYKVDLTRDVRFSRTSEEGDDDGTGVQHIATSGRERLKAWSKETDDAGDYNPGQENIRLDAKLPMGAYVVEASANGQRARDLILVTDTTMVL